jgi:hypothetical protein
MKKYTLFEKMQYLEIKFNAPMDVIMKVITFCNKNKLCVTEIKLTDK